MPTVLQVLPAMETGGVERGALEVGRALAEEGWRSLIASAGGKMLPALRGYGVEHVELPLAAKNPIAIWRNAGRLRKLIESAGVDLVHARSRAPAWSARWAARRAGRPLVTTFHSVYGGSGHPLKRRYNRVMVEAERVIAISEWVASHIREVYRVDPAIVRTIPRGVDLKTFDPAGVGGARVAALVERWGLNDEHRKIVMLPGRVVRRKGHDLLIKAAAKMERRDFVLVFVGDVDPGAGFVRELEALTAAAGLGDAVRFAGDCADMPAAYSIADVVVVPSTGAEAFGRVSIEAQAMGKPVIATNCGGLAETVAAGSTGWVIAERDADELAASIGLALGLDEEMRERLAVRARAFVAETFSTELMCARTLRVYEQLLRAAG